MFEYTNEELQIVKEKYFLNTDSLILRQFPKKLKLKYLCLVWIQDVFEKDTVYTEKEVNQILDQVYPDYVTIRRFLIDYGFLDRKSDGSSYWKTNLKAKDS